MSGDQCCSKPAVVFQLRMLLYCLLIFFSFFIFAGISIMKDRAMENGSGCPLYVDFEDNVLAEDSVCNFPMAIAIIFQLLYLLFRVVSLIFENMGKISQENHYCLFNGCMQLLYVVTELLALIFTFIGACILSAGKNAACENSQCDDVSWTSPATAAEATAWTSVGLWLAAVALGVIKFHQSGKLCGAKGEKVSADDPDYTQSQDYTQDPDYTPAMSVRTVPQRTSTTNPNFKGV